MRTTRPGRTRVGVAIDIPEPWGSTLTRRRAEAGDPQAAYTPAHVTLLGPTEVATEALSTIERHLEKVAADHPPFTVQLRGTGLRLRAASATSRWHEGGKSSS